MKEVLNFHFRVDHFIDDFDTWENKTAEHDNLAESPLQESVLATCLYSATSGALREHLDLHPDKCSDWEDLRETVTNYYTAKENAKLEAATADGTVNFVWKKGKGKGKRKGKGKGHFTATWDSNNGKGNGTGSGTGTWGNWNGGKGIMNFNLQGQGKTKGKK
jgi:hypothetical protein